MNRVRILLGTAIAALISWGCADEPVRPQADGRIFEAWAAQTAVPLLTVELNQGSVDLQPLKRTIGSARVVAFGESIHGTHELLALRNRLFEFLVQEMGFTAIAQETGFSEGVLANDFVATGVGDAWLSAQRAFSWSPEPYDENRELLEWMRRHNASATPARKIRFYGIDLSGARAGHVSGSRQTLDAALGFLDKANAPSAKLWRGRLSPYLEHFNEQSYIKLPRATQTAIAEVVDELRGYFDQQRSSLIAATSPLEYETARHQLVVAGQAVALFDKTPVLARGTKADFRDSVSARDAAMAANLQWVLDQEGSDGRVLLFAHTWHVQRGSLITPPSTEFPMSSRATAMGEHLHRALGSSMVVIGTTFESGDAALNLASIDGTSVDAVLAECQLPILLLDLRQAQPSSPASQWLARPRLMRQNEQFATVVPSKAFDAIVFVNRVTSRHPVR